MEGTADPLGDHQSDSRGPPLAGLKVLDLSRVLAGPYATMLMGDLGAEVIKVERPGSGDDTRGWGPPFVGPDGGRESTYFLSANRNKKSLVLDLKSPADRPLLIRLVEWADVVVENFRPGVMDRLGLSDEFLYGLNERLVRLTITGFGSTGPERDRVGYDQILQAEGGLMGLTGPEAGQPTRVGVPIADITAGLFGVIGTLASLFERTRSGKGQRVEVSLLGGQIAIHTFQATRYLVAGEIPLPSGNQHPTVAPYGTFSAADGPLVVAVGNDEIWARFAELLGLDDDGRYATNAGRVRCRAELTTLIEEAMRRRTVSDWLDAFAREGIPCGQIKTLQEVYTDPQVLNQGLVVHVDHPSLGDLALPGNPLRFSGSPIGVMSAPPRLGQHTAEIRREFDVATVDACGHAG